MKFKNLYRYYAVSLFLLFGIFSFFVAKNYFVGLDFDTTVKIQDLLGNKPAGVFSIFSILGSVEVASLILLLLLLISHKTMKIYVLILYCLTGVFELLGKYFIDQKGPPIAFLKTHLPFQIPSSQIPQDFFSYPSGHSARTAFISGIALLLIWRGSKMSKETKIFLSTGVLFFDFLMFLSRVYLGEHWISDVVGGLLLGYCLALLTAFILGRPFTR